MRMRKMGIHADDVHIYKANKRIISGCDADDAHRQKLFNGNLNHHHLFPLKRHHCSLHLWGLFWKVFPVSQFQEGEFFQCSGCHKKLI